MSSWGELKQKLTECVCECISKSRLVVVVTTSFFLYKTCFSQEETREGGVKWYDYDYYIYSDTHTYSSQNIKWISKRCLMLKEITR